VTVFLGKIVESQRGCTTIAMFNQVGGNSCLLQLPDRRRCGSNQGRIRDKSGTRRVIFLPFGDDSMTQLAVAIGVPEKNFPYWNRPALYSVPAVALGCFC